MATAEVPLDGCSNPGDIQVKTAPASLCGYTPASMQDIYVRWEETALISCGSILSATCAAMVMSAGDTRYIPVGFGASTVVRTTGLTGGSSSASRRLLWNQLDMDELKTAANAALRASNTTTARAYLLAQAHTMRDAFAEGSSEDSIPPALIHSILMENDTEWNRTATPCSHLVFAYQSGDTLGPTDDHTVRQCAYWRIVGRKIVTHFNLTHVVPDTFLLSSDDMAVALGRQGVLAAFVQNPSMLVVAAAHLSWIRPIRAAFRASELMHTAMAQHRLRTTQRIAERKRGNSNSTRRSIPEDDTHQAPTPGEGGMHQHNSTTTNTTKTRRTRKLLDVLSETVMQLNTGDYSEAALSIAIPVERQQALDAQNYSRAHNQTTTYPKLWPEALSLDRSYKTCPILQAGLTPLQQALRALESYYTHFDEINTRRPPHRSLFQDFPTFYTPNFTMPGAAEVFRTSSLLDTLASTLGLSPSHLAQFLADASCDNPDTEVCTAENRWTVAHLVSSMTYCDLEAVLYCSNHSYGLMHTTIFFLIVYIVIERVARFMGLPFIANIFLLLMPALIVWRSFGLSPGCFPMIPPCLIDSALDTLTSILPASIAIPPSLLCSAPGVSGCLPNCVTGNVNGTTVTTCLRSCSGMGFTSWQDPLEYLAAEVGVAESLAQNEYMATFAKGLRAKQAMMSSPDKTAYTVCAFVTSSFALPAILALISLIAVAVSLLSFVAGMGPPIINLIWSVIRYDHEDRTPEPEPDALVENNT